MMVNFAGNYAPKLPACASGQFFWFIKRPPVYTGGAVRLAANRLGQGS